MDIKTWRNISIIFCLITGTLLHFAYEWSGKNIFVGSFSAVNESIWEHLKLSFFPMLMISTIGYFLFGKNQKSYVSANSIGIIGAVSFVPIAFYTYSGIIGQNFDLVNIGIFAISIILGENIAYKMMCEENLQIKNTYLEVIVILFICFIIFTFYPPKINLFKEPLTNTYGIYRIK